MFIRKTCLWILQRQQSIDMNIIPVGKKICIQQSIKVRQQILSHGIVLFLQLFYSFGNFGFDFHGDKVGKKFNSLEVVTGKGFRFTGYAISLGANKQLIELIIFDLHLPTPEGSHIGRKIHVCRTDPGGVVCDSDKYSINGCIYNCEINFVSDITSLIQ